MNSQVFKQERVSQRETLLKTLLKRFSSLGAVAIHQFGSIAKNSSDEFSDLDLWITFNDSQVGEIVKNRNMIFSGIGKLLIKHETPKNSPLGGRYSLVIYEIDNQPYQVDFYLSPMSNAYILHEAKLIYGKDILPRGNWVLDEKAQSAQSLTECVNFLICMSFIGIKKVVRKDLDFTDFLISNYTQSKNKFFSQHAEINDKKGLVPIKLILKELSTVANPSQYYAITKILNFLDTVRELYQI